ncbi:hypothetical protein GMES_3151 [Paraglaciecola mesophila KMM 241]|uniref:Uncharacterized protein n=1 Tax=Paraglaciecola mesophila KMM 241 TaxID=1128912 RepID=K6YN76_9ALTE|nr:hypothetical protein GMES_3151 [Paraglaciecola mesophila KMM 241]
MTPHFTGIGVRFTIVIANKANGWTVRAELIKKALQMRG